MKTIEISGLGRVSLHKVAGIEVCEEVGHMETFHIGPVIKAINCRRSSGLNEKVIRKAVHSLVQQGQLENFGPGMYRWLV